LRSNGHIKCHIIDHTGIRLTETHNNLKEMGERLLNTHTGKPELCSARVNQMPRHMMCGQ